MPPYELHIHNTKHGITRSKVRYRRHYNVLRSTKLSSHKATLIASRLTASRETSSPRFSIIAREVSLWCTRVGREEGSQSWPPTNSA